MYSALRDLISARGQLSNGRGHADNARAEGECIIYPRRYLIFRAH